MSILCIVMQSGNGTVKKINDQSFYLLNITTTNMIINIKSTRTITTITIVPISLLSPDGSFGESVGASKQKYVRYCSRFY